MPLSPAAPRKKLAAIMSALNEEANLGAALDDALGAMERLGIDGEIEWSGARPDAGAPRDVGAPSDLGVVDAGVMDGGYGEAGVVEASVPGDANPATDAGTPSSDIGYSAVCNVSGGPTFPALGRTCAASTDCATFVHQTDCCGNSRAFGVSVLALGALLGRFGDLFLGHARVP